MIARYRRQPAPPSPAHGTQRRAIVGLRGGAESAGVRGAATIASVRGMAEIASVRGAATIGSVGDVAEIEGLDS